MKKTIKFTLAMSLLLAGSTAMAQETVIEGFENNTDPLGWQQVSPVAHSPNSLNGAVPTYGANHVTEGAASGTFSTTWTIPPGTVTTQANTVVAGGTTTWWGNRINIATPTGIANNTIPHSAMIRADIFNNSPDAIQISFYVGDQGGSTSYERGPLVTLTPNAATTYEWDLATVAPVAYLTGNGTLDGSSSRIRGMVIYTETQPTQAAFSMDVDNIRVVTSQTDFEAPAAPQLLSALQGPNPGELVVNWNANTELDLAGYNVYVADDTNFGSTIINRFSFPSTPSQILGPGATSVTLTGIAADTSTYVRVTAFDNATPSINESLASSTLGARLKADGSAPSDLVVLDLDAFTPAVPSFTNAGYSHMIVYNAQALAALDRHFVSTNAAAVGSGAVPLTTGGLLIWSNGLDGDDAAAPANESISLANIANLTTYVGAGGKLLISGTGLGEDLETRGDAASQEFYSTVLNADLIADNAGAVDGPTLGDAFALAAPANFPNTGPLSTGPDAFDPASTASQDNEVVAAANANGTAAFDYLAAGIPGEAGILSANVVYLAFGFETVRDPAVPETTGSAAEFEAGAAKRAALLTDAISFLFTGGPLDAEQWNMYK